MADLEDHPWGGDPPSADKDVTEDAPDLEGEIARVESHEDSASMDVNFSRGEPLKALKDHREEESEMSSLGGDSLGAPPKRATSPLESVMSGPDDTPSIQVRARSFAWMNYS